MRYEWKPQKQILAACATCECVKLLLVDNNFKEQDDGSAHAQMMRRMKEVECSKDLERSYQDCNHQQTD